jgi:integrase
VGGEDALALTLKRVRDLLTAGGLDRHFDGDGLYLQVTGKNSGFWLRRYQLRHKSHAMSVGPVRAYDLFQAREKNREISRLLAEKIDPIEVRRADHRVKAEAAAAAQAVVTFKMVAGRYLEDNQAGWRNVKHGKQWLQSLRDYVYPVIGNMPIQAVDVPAVLKVLEQPVPAAKGRLAGKFWEVRHITADRTRSRLQLILDYSKARGHRIGDNPAALAVVRHALPPRSKLAIVKNYPAAPYQEVPAILGELQQREGIAPLALRFTILTAARVGEIVGAHWDEIDLKEKLWTVPAPRTKSHREHKVPLSEPAIELLQSLPTEDGNPHLFVGLFRPALSRNALNAVLQRIGRSDITVHGFRSSFRDWAAEQTNFPSEIPELALAHAVGTDVERRYRRTTLLDHRRRLMVLWAEFITSRPAQWQPGEAVALRSRQ